MKNYSETEERFRRTEILRVLADSNDYSVNERLLKDELRERSFKASGDMIRSDAAWLESQGLVTLRDLGGMQIITLTARGGDVVEGSAIVPGINRPEPGA